MRTALGVKRFAGTALFLILALAWSSARAQTASAGEQGLIVPQKAASAQDDAIDAQIAAWSASPARPEGAPAPGEGAAPPRQIHGEAGAAIGSNGYREGYVTTEIPLGTEGTLGLGVDAAQVKLKNGPTISQRSVALSLVLGQPQIPEGCGSLLVNNEVTEPLWVTHLRGAALAPGQPICGSPP